ncbi:MAG: 2OG-Fe(II) oxygenase [Nannocystaceae bacterium]
MTLPTLRRPTPEGQILCLEPLVWRVDDVVSADECEHIIGLAEPSRRRAQVSDEASGRTSDGRTNDVVWVPHHSSERTTAVCERLADLVGLPLINAEAMQVICYEVGQEYRPHFDAYDLSTPRGQRCCARGGQRLATVLVYLCDVEAGGGTRFPKVDLTVRARQGRALFFHNCRPDTDIRDPRTLHAGLPVERGRKWAFNLWFRVGAFR